jgi:type IV secretory pathway TraG/TraD family ATPase VirD4
VRDFLRQAMRHLENLVMLNSRFLGQVILAIFLLSAGATLSASIILPENFNPQTCEQDRLLRENKWAYEGYSCAAMGEAYKWNPLETSILDATNSLGAVDPRNSAGLDKLKSSISALAEAVKRIRNDFIKPELEKRDLLGDYLNRQQKAFADRDWPVPTTMHGVFEDLQTRISKDYVSLVDRQNILYAAQNAGLDLVQLTQEVSRVMVADVIREQGLQTFADAKQRETQLNTQAAQEQVARTYAENVANRAAKFRGLGAWIFSAVLFSGFGVFLLWRPLQSNRRRFVTFSAGTAALFLAQMLASGVHVVSGIPQWAAFLVMLLIFGIIYVFFRDKINVWIPLGSESVGTHGSAAGSALADAVRCGRLFDRGQVSADSYGFALGRFQNAPANFDPRLRYMGHVLTCAPTGSGKGVGAVIPALLEYPGSAVVLDIKGENYAVTARARQALGQAVYLVDPFGVTGGPQCCFNPLDTLDLAHPDVVGQASALVDALVVSGSNQDDNSAHFNDSAKDLIRGVMVYVASVPDAARRNLGEVRRMLTLPLASEANNPRESLMDHLSDMSADTELAFGIPARCANGFISKDSKEASGVHSTALRHTAFLDDPRIAAALSRSDFRFSELKRQSMTVFVVMPPDRLAAQSRFMRALVGAALSAITANSDKPRFNVLFLLDEFAQLGRMPAIEDAISLVRGYGARFWLFVQDLSQLKGVYPKWQTFLANSAKQFYGTADFESAKYISDMLGQSTIKFETFGDSASTSMQGGSSGTSSSQQLTGRSLLTPDEVMRQGPNRPIVLIQGERPYILARLNYLTDSEYTGLADPNPFHR